MKRVMLLFAIVIFSALSCDLAPQPDTVEYKISGTTDSVSVTLSNASGGTEQYSTVTVPYTYSYDSFPYWFMYISAQNNHDSGSVQVEVYLNGNLIESARSEGAYVIATASGSK